MANMLSLPGITPLPERLLPLTTTAEQPVASGLVGIARMAAKGDAVDQGHQVEFRSLQIRSILNKSVSRRKLSFSRSINPYRGCEFACRYCYARYTHEFMELKQPEDFERRIFIKQNAAWLLRQELRELRPGEEIAIGTATDPYQPIERRARITRSLLEVLAQCRNLRIGIVSKSTLITRDIDLLKEIARRSTLVVHITITTTDVDLARMLEPRAPRPDLRFETVAKLRQAGICTGVLCSPLLPGLTDYPAALEAVAVAAKRADASFLCAQPLFLKSCSKATYLDFIREHFPALEPMYRQRFDSAEFVSKAYAQRMRLMVHRVCTRHELAERSSDALLTRDLGGKLGEKNESPAAQPLQGSLFTTATLPVRATPRPVSGRAQRVMMVS
jgi:DNA repair photolyase